MRGQTQLISAVLIFGIVAGLVMSAYIWGMPIIRKTSDVAQYEFAKQSFFEINNAILEVARTENQRSVNLKLNRGILKVYKDLNLLEYSFSSRVPLVTTQKWVVLNEDDSMGVVEYGGNCTNDSYCISNWRNNSKCILERCTCKTNKIYPPQLNESLECLNGTGVLGGDKAGIIYTKAFGEGDSYLIKLKLKYREIIDLEEASPQSGYLINFTNSGSVGKGTHTITVEYKKRSHLTGGSNRGGDLVVTDISIDL